MTDDGVKKAFVVSGPKRMISSPKIARWRVAVAIIMVAAIVG
jgi:hypothetical protein